MTADLSSLTVGDPVQALGALIALVALVYAARGVRLAARELAHTAEGLALSHKTGKAQFWLTLRDHFARHDPVHHSLRPGGEWTDDEGRPRAGRPRPEELPAAEAYMGLFEHCEFMLEDDLIDAATFRHIYRYRLVNILNNPVIVETKLVRRARDWAKFRALLRRFGLPDPGAAS